jgi:hypothetical protein
MSCWGGEPWILPQEKEGSEGSECRDKTMMVKLII